MWMIKHACTYSGRSPHGERGLKSWLSAALHCKASRSPHGERGLKFLCFSNDRFQLSRSPHGERGLKCDEFTGVLIQRLVALLMESVD